MRRSLIWCVAALAALVTNLSTVRFIDSVALNVGSSQATGAEVLIATLSDPYTLLYVWALALLVTNMLHLRHSLDDFQLIRHRSRADWVMAQALQGVRNAGIGILFLLIVSFALMVGRPFGGWGPVSFTDVSGNEALNTMSSHLPPVAAVAVQLACLVTFAFGLSLAQSILQIVFRRPFFAIVLTSSFWIYTLVSFKSGVEWSAFMKPVNYLVAFHSFSDIGSVIPVYIATLLFSAVAVLLFYSIEKAIFVGLGITLRNPVILAALILMAFMLLATFFSGADSPIDSLLYVYSGVSKNGFSILPFGVHLVSFVGPAFVTYALFARRLSADVYNEVIRVGSPVRWMTWTLKRSSVVVIVLTFSGSLGAIAGGTIQWFSESSGAKSIDISSLGVTTLYLFGITILQGLFYFVLMVALTMVLGKINAGIYGLGAITFALLPIFRFTWSPIGVASTESISLSVSTITSMAIILVVSILSSFAICLLLAKHKDVQFY